MNRAVALLGLALACPCGPDRAPGGTPPITPVAADR